MFEERYRSHHDSKKITDKIISENLKKLENKNIKLESILKSEGKKDERVLYVHTPYCDKLCTFCNLNREQLKGKIADYSDYIVNEFEKFGKTEYVNSKPFQVVYFGGGTPTVYNEVEMEKVLKSLRKNFQLTEDVEFTFETTVHNLTKEKLKIMENNGVNRLSIGIQTFLDRGRKILNRTFLGNEVLEKLFEIKENFKGMVCGDIIYSYPTQTVEEVIKDAQNCIKVNFDSVSFYSLMVSKGSVLEKQINEGKFPNTRTDESDRENHNSFLEKMYNNGYELLELSKLNKKNRDRYNYIKYRYRNADTFPVGVGAGGTVDEIGVYNMSKMAVMEKFIEKDYFKYNEILGLMQYGVYDKNLFKNYIDSRTLEVMFEKFEEISKKGFTQKRENIHYLTKDGVFWGNNIAVELMKIIIPLEMESV